MNGFFSWPNASVNQNLQKIALRGLIDWFVMHMFFTEGVLLVCSSGLKAVEIVMICEITCSENHVQFLGEHVGFHIQFWMAVFWLGRIYCRQRCFCSLLSCYQSPVGLMSLWLRLCLQIWSSVSFRVWKSRLVDTHRLKWKTYIKQPYSLTVFHYIE